MRSSDASMPPRIGVQPWGADERDQHGEGGGFGVVAWPAGAIVITNGTVTGQPAVDVDRVVTLAAAVVAIGFLTVGRRRRVRR
ncbi:hypothetical protein GCM10027451_00840 [Geodermatophilus aquaeductus]